MAISKGAKIKRRLFLGGALASGACARIPRLPGQDTLTAYSYDDDVASRRPLITIPGILGSRLRLGPDGDFIWGGPRRLSLDTNTPDAISDLSLPIGDGTAPLNTLTDGVDPSGVLRRANARILGATVEEEVYDGLVTSLNAGGYQFSRTLEEEKARRGENPGSLEFPYDWRRDIVEAARALDAFVERKAQQVHRVRKAAFGEAIDPDRIRFDVVAHSMGGLVLRYWMMYGAQDLPDDGSLPELTWVGARRTACAIFVAPPNLGSVSSMVSIVDGREFGLFQPFYPPALVGSHVAIYQLMPRARHNRVLAGSATGSSVGDIYDAALWEDNRWGLMDPSQDEILAVLLPKARDSVERRRRARSHLQQVLDRAEQFHRAIDRPGTPRGTDMFLVVGTGLDTEATAILDPDTGRITPSILEEGDGTVLRSSALSDDRQGGNERRGPRRPIRYRTVLLLPGEHVSITSNPVFSDNLLYWLLDSPTVRGTAG
jgi:pimeloyl-ACP methyl ester carboxylesterase